MRVFGKLKNRLGIIPDRISPLLCIQHRDGSLTWKQ
ncbi:hypothetical protein E2C01_030966 [Portunus trituberculatus]|uniref:Uncharacterized protein n=1 Tax=Portunus trituberculatus TaxID=210409 RepID=A0A5B7EWC3_PORTR|nr:hypothetical protein [Portunus trituberculatus]